MSDMNELRKLAGIKKVEEVVQLDEGRMASIKNPILSVYGVESLGEFYTKMEKDLPSILKKTTGFMIRSKEKNTPIALIMKKGDELVGIGIQNGELRPLVSTAVFMIKDIKP